MKHNNYKEGKFQNIEFVENGIEKSIGVLESGSYSFKTEKEELVRCLTGKIKINNVELLPGEETVIGKNEDFEILSDTTSSYLCVYS